ncbi:arabinan endo-1,5-alpha-L-arabinosidase [Filimonas zeae]|uniref:Arabinan endo-1,5-alpha-L-arabinosidase n=1 Tax=Filimonas zeae TaxID=1737353 RepID=A0A917IZZ3_9BACT|nr:arabinan endo-1,5-alpha-L-arabinosidase [Filimonas zeae]
MFPGWYADPEGAVFNGKYWIYPTTSDLYEKQVYFDAFSSPDLVHWTKHAAVLDTARVLWADKAMWAPAVVEKDSRYYFFFSANDVHPGEVGGIGVAVGNTPAGPFTDYLKKPLIDTIINGAQPIDQFVFRDKDGTYYMYYGGWQHCNIVRLKADFTGILPMADGTLYKEVTPEGYVEGPFLFVRNNRYYFMWSEGGWGRPDYKVAYAIADNPFGPFKRIGVVLQQDTTVATSAGHHSVIQVPGKDEWYIVYHRRPLGDKGRDHRETCIEKMQFDAQGHILPVKLTREGVAPVQAGKVTGR